MLAGSVALNYGRSASVAEAQTAASAAMQAVAPGAKPSAEQDKAIKAWQEVVSHTTATPESAQEQRLICGGSWWHAVTTQLPFSYAFQWTGMPYFLFIDMIPFMLIGMAPLKLGVLSAARPARTMR